MNYLSFIQVVRFHIYISKLKRENYKRSSDLRNCDPIIGNNLERPDIFLMTGAIPRENVTLPLLSSRIDNTVGAIFFTVSYHNCYRHHNPICYNTFAAL